MAVARKRMEIMASRGRVPSEAVSTPSPARTKRLVSERLGTKRTHHQSVTRHTTRATTSTGSMLRIRNRTMEHLPECGVELKPFEYRHAYREQLKCHGMLVRRYCSDERKR